MDLSERKKESTKLAADYQVLLSFYSTFCQMLACDFFVVVPNQCCISMTCQIDLEKLLWSIPPSTVPNCIIKFANGPACVMLASLTLLHTLIWFTITPAESLWSGSFHCLWEEAGMDGENRLWGQGIPSRGCNWLPMKDPDGTFLASTKNLTLPWL